MLSSNLLTVWFGCGDPRLCVVWFVVLAGSTIPRKTSKYEPRISSFSGVMLYHQLLGRHFTEISTYQSIRRSCVLHNRCRHYPPCVIVCCYCGVTAPPRQAYIGHRLVLSVRSDVLEFLVDPLERFQSSIVHQWYRPGWGASPWETSTPHEYVSHSHAPWWTTQIFCRRLRIWKQIEESLRWIPTQDIHRWWVVS